MPAPVIGASLPRKEDRRLLLGAGRFLDDLMPEGTLHLGVVRSREAHARIAAVALKDALAAPGVLAAWAAADLPEVARPIPAAYGGAHKGRPFEQPVLAREVVRYVGEPVAVVIADSVHHLADALELVTVDYEPLTPVTTPEEALTTAARLHPGWPDNVALTARGAIGDAEQGMAGAHVVIRERMRHPRIAAVPIETRGVLAYRDRESDDLVVWSSTQSPYRLRDALAAVLGRSGESLRVMAPDVGGGFGPKGAMYPEESLVAAACLRLNRPVKWVESRRENLMTTAHDRDQVHDARIGFTREGTIAAIQDEFLADVGAYPLEGDGLTLNTVNHLPGPYRVQHYRNVATSVVTCKMPGGAYRAAGRPEAVFVMERLMDMGARRLGIDPADLRRRNLVRPEEMPYRSGLTYKDGVPVSYDPGDFPAAFERLLTLFGYTQWRARQAERGTRVQRIGIGLACYAQGTGIGPYESATIRVDPSGKVYVLIGVAAQGQGHATTLAQIAAAELGASFDDVIVSAGDTRLAPFGMGTGGSRVAANAGPAVAGAAREVRSRAARVAAEILEAAPEDVRIENGQAYVVGVPGRTVGLGRLAHVAVKSKALRPVGQPGLNACTYFYPDTVTWAFGAHAAAVEVDVETCAMRLLAYALVHDPGRAINPTIVEGQLHGGAVQGLAAGLWEGVVYDAAGQLVTGSFMDYVVPRADDLPWIGVVLDEHPSIQNDLGIKGVGESGAIGGAAAIANAVEDAVADLGVTVRELPITPARLFAQIAGRS